VLVLFAVCGFIYGNSEVVRQEFLHQVYSTLDPSSGKAVAGIGASTGKPTASALATVVGIAVALFGASGVFGQLQDALNVIWGVKPKPGNSIASFLRARFLSFAMVAGVFLVNYEHKKARQTRCALESTDLCFREKGNDLQAGKGRTLQDTEEECEAIRIAREQIMPRLAVRRATRASRRVET
jgi:hypothetical protein